MPPYRDGHRRHDLGAVRGHVGAGEDAPPSSHIVGDRLADPTRVEQRGPSFGDRLERLGQGRHRHDRGHAGTVGRGPPLRPGLHRQPGQGLRGDQRNARARGRDRGCHHDLAVEPAPGLEHRQQAAQHPRDRHRQRPCLVPRIGHLARRSGRGSAGRGTSRESPRPGRRRWRRVPPELPSSRRSRSRWPHSRRSHYSPVRRPPP